MEPNIVDATAGTQSFEMADGRGAASASSNVVLRMRLSVRASLSTCISVSGSYGVLGCVAIYGRTARPGFDGAIGGPAASRRGLARTSTGFCEATIGNRPFILS
jgi:hypothetical protein